MKAAKKVNVSYLFDLRSHVIVKRGKLVSNKYVSRVLYVKCRLPGETFCFLKKVCCHYYQFKFYVTHSFLRAADWSTTNFIGMYCYFPVIRFIFYRRIINNYSANEARSAECVAPSWL